MPGSSDLSHAGIRPAAFAGVAILCLALAACGGSPKDKQAAATPGQTPATTDAASPAGPAGAPASPTPGASTAAAPQAAAPAAVAAKPDTSTWVLQPPFYAAGDEPFWRLELADGWFLFQRSGLAQIEAQIPQPKREKGADVFSAAPLTVKIKREPCETDGGGKTDTSAIVTFDGIDYEGCAFAGAEAAASPEAAAVADAIGTVDACLAKLGEPALVTGVYPREGGRTAVALRERNGSQFECAAEPGGKEIAFLDPVEQGAAAPYMTVMRFLREGIAAPACPDAKEVRSGDTVVGRMLSPKCKF
jgi:uncharacterized membrane protein